MLLLEESKALAAIAQFQGQIRRHSIATPRERAYQKDPGGSQKARTKRNRLAILTFLEKKPNQAVLQIAKATGINRKTCDRVIRNLALEGNVTGCKRAQDGGGKPITFWGLA